VASNASSAARPVPIPIRTVKRGQRRAAGLRGFCRWLLSSRLLEVDPWIGVTLSAGRQRKLPRVVPSHELDLLFGSLRAAAAVDAAANPDDGVARPHESTRLLAVALMVTTGMRVNEVVNIRCRDIDLPSRNLRIVGKGRRERQVFLTNDWIADLTCRYLKTRATLGFEHPQLLFNSRFASAPLPTASSAPEHRGWPR
jgi:site-specific recombinase XerC